MAWCLSIVSGTFVQALDLYTRGFSSYKPVKVKSGVDQIEKKSMCTKLEHTSSSSRSSSGGSIRRGDTMINRISSGSGCSNSGMQQWDSAIVLVVVVAVVVVCSTRVLAE